MKVLIAIVWIPMFIAFFKIVTLCGVRPSYCDMEKKKKTKCIYNDGNCSHCNGPGGP